ncbi:MAG: hypothetical protein FJY99_06485 [Candidatus Sericytochromatia bacterium]|nr:hypothetical protein [Candidatus Tanganyikabacteria bacterium]
MNTLRARAGGLPAVARQALWAMAVTGLVAACADHRLAPAAPERSQPTLATLHAQQDRMVQRARPTPPPKRRLPRPTPAVPRVTPSPAVTPSPVPTPTPTPAPTPGISTVANVRGHLRDGQGNLYGISGSSLMKVTPSGTLTVATSPYLGGDTTLGGVDAQGNVYGFLHIGCRIIKIAPDGVVTTFAGNGSAGFADGAGTAARFNRPAGLVLDAQDNLYVSDYWNNRIRKITPAGVVSTFSGSGIAGSVDGTAGTARFTEPMSICRDGLGNFWQVDHNGHRIRRIAPDGSVTTLTNAVGTAVSYTYPLSIAYSRKLNGVLVSPKFAYRIDFIDLTGNLTTLV